MFELNSLEFKRNSRNILTKQKAVFYCFFIALLLSYRRKLPSSIYYLPRYRYKFCFKVKKCSRTCMLTVTVLFFNASFNGACVLKFNLKQKKCKKSYLATFCIIAFCIVLNTVMYIFVSLVVYIL